MEICELVPSQKGNDKLNFRGYLTVKGCNNYYLIGKGESQQLLMTGKIVQ
jgi:hypothetical protein